MAVRANLIVGAIGAVLALASGSIIAVNWESLVGLETWEARFTLHDAHLPERAATLAAGGTRNEVFEIATANVTHVNLHLTWRDPALNAPEVTVRLLDPSRKVRAEESHTGGSTGIHLQIDIIEPGDFPTGIETYRVRTDPQDLNARTEFETRWPARDESRGDWSVEIRSAAPDGPSPSGSISYNLRADYAYFTGVFAKLPESVK